MCFWCLTWTPEPRNVGSTMTECKTSNDLSFTETMRQAMGLAPAPATAPAEPAELPAMPPPAIDREAVLAWFTGKAREKAAVALDGVLRSVEQGWWEPKVSRSARAALSKANVAQAALRGPTPRVPNRKPGICLGLDLIGPRVGGQYSNAMGYTLSSAMQYGSLDRLDDVHPDALRAACLNERERIVVEHALRYFDAFAPLARAMRELDDTRPQPVFTYLGVSLTVTETIEGLNLKPGTVRVCPVKWTRVQVIDPKTNRKVWTWEGHLDWPENTVHGASRYSVSAANNRQCQACGHAIQRPENWAPLLIDGDKDNRPHALWVGRDCAEDLFGIKVKGDMRFAPGTIGA